MNIELEKITKEFLEGTTYHAVLKGISLIFQQGKSYAITGVSGSGKSSLLQIIGGLDKPTSGQVKIGGVMLSGMSHMERCALHNKRLGFVFQFHYLIREISVIENIMMPGLIAGVSQNECFHRANEFLEYLGLQEKAHEYPYTLSGGQQQRVAIARALFNKPHFVLADEPTGNLDEEGALRIVELFLRCSKDWGLGFIVATHDPVVYGRMDTVLYLHDGILHKK